MRVQVRKGMVLVDERLAPRASWEFDADIAILTHSTTIAPRYQAVVHCEIIRQAARVVAMDKERLRSGDRACVRFRCGAARPGPGACMHAWDHSRHPIGAPGRRRARDECRYA